MSPDGSELQTCTIVTTTANNSLASIHARMPVILAPDDFVAWLDVRDETDTAPASAALLRPAPEETTTARPVSTQVNSVRNDNSSLIEAVDPLASTDEDAAGPVRDGQGDLFSN